METLRILLNPLKYLIIHSRLKRIFDFVIPVVFGILTALLITFYESEIVLLGDHGLITICGRFLLQLPGFYIAALAVVGSMSRPGLDDEIAGNDAPKLRGKIITRRRFLTTMFGFLFFACCSLYLIGELGRALTPGIKPRIQDVCLFGYPASLIAKVIFSGLYMVAFSQMATTTLFGLYYLTDRLYRSNTRVHGFIPASSNASSSHSQEA